MLPTTFFDKEVTMLQRICDQCGKEIGPGFCIVITDEATGKSNYIHEDCADAFVKELKEYRNAFHDHIDNSQLD